MMRDLTREERREELGKMAKSRVANVHRAGAGCLMDHSELMTWTKDELIIAVLDAEYGPRNAPESATTSEGA